MITAKVVAHSKSEFGPEIITFVCRFPRFILAEAKTHRILKGLLNEVTIEESVSFNDTEEASKNSASSRAVKDMIRRVEEDSFTPIAWQKNHPGMQGTEYFDNPQDIAALNSIWNLGKELAIERAKDLQESGATKQIFNRLLEPFMWHTAIITATEWDNFFELRCPQYVFEENGIPKHTFKSRKDYIKYIGQNTDGKNFALDYSELDWLKINKGQAEIHMMALAEAMWDAMNESTPKLLKPGEWHIPFGDRIDQSKLEALHYGKIESTTNTKALYEYTKVQIATARCARVSYINYEGTDDYVKDLKLFDQLLSSKHMSPFEHCARAMSEREYNLYAKSKPDSKAEPPTEDSNFQFINFAQKEKGWCRNFRGFIQLREEVEQN